MDRLLRKFDPLIHLFFLVAIIILTAGFFYLWRRSVPLAGELTTSPVPTATTGSGVSSLTPKDVDSLIAKAIASLSGVPKAVAQKVTAPQKESRVTYIPMGGSASTTSRDWVDVDNSEVFIDLVNDFGEEAKVAWEASLKVAYGNGAAYARLWDDTHKIAVNGSEIVREGNADYETVWQNNLSLWRGKNLYKVQIKSLTGYEVTYGNGRIKITY